MEDAINRSRSPVPQIPSIEGVGLSAAQKEAIKDASSPAGDRGTGAPKEPLTKEQKAVAEAIGKLENQINPEPKRPTDTGYPQPSKSRWPGGDNPAWQKLREQMEKLPPIGSSGRSQSLTDVLSDAGVRITELKK